MKKLLEALIESTNEAKDLWVPRTIQQVTEIRPLQFYRDFVGRNVPLLIKNGCSSWPALSKWTNEYLKSLKEPVTVAITPDGHGDCIKNGIFVLPYEQQMTISEFFDQNKSSVYYIQKQCSSMTLEFPELLSDISELDFATEAFGQSPDAINFWMGNEKAVSSTHKDPYENIYCVVSGTKVITLLPPTDMPYLYRTKYPVGEYCKDFSIKMHDSEVPWIPVDPDSPDLSKYPFFEHASPITVRIEKGDVLYLPSLWFHKVKQENDDQGRCIAVNFWYDMKFDARYTWSVFQDHINPLIHE